MVTLDLTHPESYRYSNRYDDFATDHHEDHLIFCWFSGIIQNWLNYPKFSNQFDVVDNKILKSRVILSFSSLTFATHNR
ncbi:hypothetical protein WN51_09254 [Melipona quadrifasciata]|uniref:Uncharacterized protein n=1 Tax=Melipona quadrifasciata TaxID=166423 RepID=A0A0M9A5E5_9HYME|nr:hypothetical protein WN51_09254 [Melipona quadrifasciata]